MPDVLLHLSDLKWFITEASNTHVDAEPDWHRLWPPEIVLLGADAVAASVESRASAATRDDAVAVRAFGTITVGFPTISLARYPLVASDLVAVLTKLARCSSTNISIARRATVSLGLLVDACRHSTQLASVLADALANASLGRLLADLDDRVALAHLQVLQRLRHDSLPDWVATSGLHQPHTLLDEGTRSVLSLALAASASVSTLQQLMHLSASATLFSLSASLTLQLLLVLANRIAAALDDDELVETAASIDNATDKEQQSTPCSVVVDVELALASSLLDTLTALTRLFPTTTAASSSSSSSSLYAHATLGLAVSLAASDTISLATVRDTLAQLVPSLLNYSSEGYLARDDSTLFPFLMRMARVALEYADLEPHTVATSIIPTVFSPFFGQVGHACVCQSLLEYTEGALRLRARPSLLSDVLHRISLVWHQVKALTTVLSTRTLFLTSLLSLARTLASHGRTVGFTMAVELPNTIALVRKWIATDATVDADAAVMLLARLCAVVDRGVAAGAMRSFHIFTVTVPRLVAALDSAGVATTQHLSAISAVVDSLESAIAANKDVSVLITPGIDVVSLALRPRHAVTDLHDLTERLARRFLKAGGHSAALLMLHATGEQLTKLLLVEPAEASVQVDLTRAPAGVGRILRALIQSARHQDVRALRSICRPVLSHARYAPLREALFGNGKGEDRDEEVLEEEDDAFVLGVFLAPICAVIAMDMVLVQRYGRHAADSMGGVSARDILTDLVRQVEMRSLTADSVRLLTAQMERLTLLCLLFAQGRHEQQTSSSSVPVTPLPMTPLTTTPSCRADHTNPFTFPPCLPAWLDAAPATFQVLLVIARRLEHTQLPRYAALRRLATELLRASLLSDTCDSPATFYARLAHEVSRLTENQAIEERLLEWGYERVCAAPATAHCEFGRELVRVRTTGRRSVENALRRSLVVLYSLYIPLLRDLQIREVDVDGVVVERDVIFGTSDDDVPLSLEELRGRRAIVTRAIDRAVRDAQHGARATIAAQVAETKMALLADEERMETASADAELSVSVSTTASDELEHELCAYLCDDVPSVMKCCGANIVGCYAPDGCHAEKPLELALRRDAGVISIRDVRGVEIENAEFILTSAGVYVCKAYTNGHALDTSEVWSHLVGPLLRATGAPALILPHNLPTPEVFEGATASVGLSLEGLALEMRVDFLDECASYWDNMKMERVRCGYDCVVARESVGRLVGKEEGDDEEGERWGGGGEESAKKRKTTKKDLAGILSEEILVRLREMDSGQWMFLGSLVVKGVAMTVEQGVGSGSVASVVARSFDYERFVGQQQAKKRKGKKKKKTKKRRAEEGEEKEVEEEEEEEEERGEGSSIAVETKEAIVERIATVAEQTIERVVREFDDSRVYLSRLTTKEVKCSSASIGVVWEMIKMMERSRMIEWCALKWKQLRKGVRERIALRRFEAMSATERVETMRWIFRNEDRVWRYRGGRGAETLSQFLGFLPWGNAIEAKEKECVSGKWKGLEEVKEEEEEEEEEGEGEEEEEDREMRWWRARNVAGVVASVSVAEERGAKRKIVGYAVGEYRRNGEGESSHDDESVAEVERVGRRRKGEVVYEVVTAFVDEMCRGMGLAGEMYGGIVEQVEQGNAEARREGRAVCEVVLCDVLEGTYERFIGSSKVLCALEWLGIMQRAVRKRDQSYSVELSPLRLEQFERLELDVWRLAKVLYLSRLLSRSFEWIQRTFSIC